jgi:hypothetical protein
MDTSSDKSIDPGIGCVWGLLVDISKKDIDIDSHGLSLFSPTWLTSFHRAYKYHVLHVRISGSACLGLMVCLTTALHFRLVYTSESQPKIDSLLSAVSLHTLT